MPNIFKFSATTAMTILVVGGGLRIAQSEQMPKIVRDTAKFITEGYGA